MTQNQPQIPTDIHNGLTDAQVLKSRKLYGVNVFTPPPKPSAWKEFLSKFRDPLIIILVAAALLSIGISCYEYWSLHEGLEVFFEPVGIIAAIVLATGLSFYFEKRADKEFAILNQVNDDELVRVVRGGNTTEVPRRDIVVGDLVILSTGDEVPADGVLTEAVMLTLDESTLTGEPACHKTTDPADFDPEATYPSDRVLRGTKVMEGHGRFIVDKVGDATENGKVFVETRIDSTARTPLSEQLERLGGLIAKASYAVAALVIVGRCVMYAFDPAFTSFFTVAFGAYLLQSVMIAVTLVVVAVPEGLPMAVTLALAYSMRRMLKTNNLVRKLHACETMGSATVICTDKTGTLTKNQMQVVDARFFGDIPMESIAVQMGLNSTASLDLSGKRPTALGNPTEGALLLWLWSQGFDYRKLRADIKPLAELPFSTERKFMATIIEDEEEGGCGLICVKGAPEIVMGLCTSISGGISEAEIQALLLSYQNQAMRTLGFAAAPLPEGISAQEATELLRADPKRLQLAFEGVVAISDPIRRDVPAAVKECTGAGIKIKIVTGDTPATAREIGRQIGLVTEEIAPGEILTGPEFAALSDEQLPEAVGKLKIMARARPGDKKRLVEALQQAGEVVAVTGDGTNDAPALKAAHVGLSMGYGTSVAKEASDITIINNSFASIGRAVMWGRSLFLNIRRFILFQLTVNVAACLIVLAGAFMGTESPLTVTQMLWVNLIMDTFAAMALASLPPTREVMNEPPRDRRASIIDGAMWRFITGVGGIFFFLLLGLLYVFEHSDITSLSQLPYIHVGARNPLTPYELSLFFTIFVFLQFWNLFNARAFRSGHSAFRLKGCGEFLFIAMLIFVGQIAIVEFGGAFFNVTPLQLADWLWIIGGTSLVLWLGEAARLFKR